MSEKQVIFDFCKWLGSQGCSYEVIYYGDYDEIKEVIDKYLTEKDINYIKLSLSNLRIGHSQLMLDLPLDYHSEDFDNSFMDLVDELEDLIKDYEARIL